MKTDSSHLVGFARVVDAILNPEIEIDIQVKFAIVRTPFKWAWLGLFVIIVFNKFLVSPYDFFNMQKITLSFTFIACAVALSCCSYALGVLLRYSVQAGDTSSGSVRSLSCLFYLLALACLLDAGFFYPYVFTLLGSCLSIVDCKEEKRKKRQLAELKN